jgi:Permease MlaE
VIGADALPVTSAANLLVELIIGFLGVSQLGRFGAVVYVPELVVVAHFRELGPLVTAIVVAGRSGIASPPIAWLRWSATEPVCAASGGLSFRCRIMLSSMLTS